MATSKFLRLFLTNAAEPLLGATIYLVPQAQAYPTGAILLTAHPTRAGMYQADGVAHGEYKIYIGSGTPALYTEHIWVGENFISIIANGFDVATGQLTTAGIKDGAVTGDKLATASVTESKVASNAITTTKVADNAITSDKIAPNAVTVSEIEDGAVTSTKIDVGAVNTNNINENAVTADKIATGAVTTDKLADNSVSRDKIGSDCAGSGLTANVSGALDVAYDEVTLGIGIDYYLCVLDDGIDKSKIHPNVAGAGLGQNVDGSLEVKTDGVSLEVVSDQVRLKRKEILGILQFSGGGRSFSSIYNSAGVTVSLTREDVGVYSITASGSVFTVSKTLSLIQPLTPAQVHIGVRRYSDTLIRIESEDSSGAAVDLDGNFYISILIFP